MQVVPDLRCLSDVTIHFLNLFGVSIALNHVDISHGVTDVNYFTNRIRTAASITILFLWHCFIYVRRFCTVFHRVSRHGQG